MESLHKQDYEESASLLHKSLQILKLSKSSDSSFKLKAVTLNNLGILYYTIKDFPKALQFLSSALEVSRNLSTDVINRAGTHLNICAIKSGMSQHEQALQHALTAIQMLNIKKADFSPTLVVAYHSAGIEYQFLNLPLKARNYFEYGYNLAAQKLGKNHSLTLSLEEALQDFYGYKAKTRQKSNDAHLDKVKVNEMYLKENSSKKYPKYVSPLEKIYKQDLGVKNRPENSFLASPMKVRKRVFVRQEVSSRVRDMIMQNRVRDESLKNFNLKALSHFDKKYEDSEESDQEEAEETSSKKLDSGDTEGLINKFREEIAEGSQEESSVKPAVSKPGSFIKTVSNKTVEIQLTKREFSSKSIKRDINSSPCGLDLPKSSDLQDEDIKTSQLKSTESQIKDSKSQIKDSESQIKDSESQIRDSKSQIKDSESQIKDSDIESFPDNESSALDSEREVAIDEEKLKLVENTIQHLDNKLKAFSDDHKKLIFFQTELKDPAIDLQARNREKEALLIQKTFRGWVEKQKYNKIRVHIIKIQIAWREFRYKKYLKSVENVKKDFSQQLSEKMLVVHPEKTNSEVQTEVHAKPENRIETKSLEFIQPYNMYKSFYRTIVYIQAHVRGFLCRKLRERKMKAIVKIQASTRMHQTRQIYLDIIQAVVVIQQTYRKHLQKKRKRMPKSKQMRLIKK